MKIREEIRNWLIKGIKAGDFPLGAPLPSRHDLMKRFSAARATVDHVLRELGNEGWSVSRKGAGTYVAEILPEEQSAFLVNTPSFFVETLCKHLNGRISYELLSSAEVIQAFPRMAKRGSRIVWHTPGQASHYFIEMFHEARIPQILINRRHERVSFLTTDTRKGLESAIGRLCAAHPRAPWAALLPPLMPGSYFLAEREIFFYEILAKHRKTVDSSLRAQSLSQEEIAGLAGTMLDLLPRPGILFCPDLAMVHVLLTLARERGILLGTEIFLLATDREPSLTDTAGVTALEQDWREMAVQAARWLRTGRPPLLQSTVPHKTISPEYLSPASVT